MQLIQIIPPQAPASWDKKQLMAFAHERIETLLEEGGDVVSLLAQAAKLEYMAGQLKEAARQKQAVVDEVRDYGKGGITRYGVTFTTKEVGVTYDYSVDYTWQGLHQAVVTATAARKAHETYLKALPYEGRLYTDEGTGELYRAYPPAKRGGDGLIISIL